MQRPRARSSCAARTRASRARSSTACSATSPSTMGRARWRCCARARKTCSREPQRRSAVARRSAGVRPVGHPRPEPYERALVFDADLQRELPAARSILDEAVAHLLVDAQLGAVGVELLGRQRVWVGAKEQLQRGGVADLLELAGRLGQPCLQRRAPALGDAVGAPAPAALLAPLVEQPRLRQARALAV